MKHHTEAITFDDFSPEKSFVLVRTAAHVGDTVTINGELYVIEALPINKEERRVVLGSFPSLKDSMQDAIRLNKNPFYYLASVKLMDKTN